MPRNPKLTWQSGTDSRKGRWKKKYKNQVHYFDGGRGKSDRDAYQAALTAWDDQKRKIDAAAPKSHQAAYEAAIAEWELVLAWCRQHGEEEMAATAVATIERLRNQLSLAEPPPLTKAVTFEGRFDQTIRFPKYQEALEAVGQGIDLSPAPADLTQTSEDNGALSSNGSLPGDDSAAESGRSRTVIVPVQEGLDPISPLALEKEVWRDRLQVMQRSALSPEQTVAGNVKLFLQVKQDNASAELVSVGRVEKLRSQLSDFQDWIGGTMPVVDVNGQKLVEYRAELLKKVEAGVWSRTTANERMSTLKTFVRWLWQIEAIPVLPRVLDTKSRALEIGKSQAEIVVFTIDEIQKLLENGSKRTILYLLLMLNSGMTQKDLADLTDAEVDWNQGRIIRKRSKTRRHKNVPKVSYLLWAETFSLLQQERNTTQSGRVLLNENGSPLWEEKHGVKGKYQKTDNVRTAFERLRRKLKIEKSLKSLKKTSASLLRGNKDYEGLEDLFLGHAPTKMSGRHYAKPPQELLDEAMGWLRDQYRLSNVASISNG